MFRFQIRQIHTMLILLFVISACVFGFFGISKLQRFDEGESVPSMQDFSEGWVYNVEDANLVTSFPAHFDAGTEQELRIVHRIPDMTTQSLYMVFETDRQPVKVFVDSEMVYESTGKNNRMRAYHVVLLHREYSGKNVSFCYDDVGASGIDVGRVLLGDKTQFVGQLIADNLPRLLLGGICILVSVCMFLLYALTKNSFSAKRMLLYTNIEGILLGVFCILTGNLMPLLTGWNYGVAMLRFFVLALALFSHLMIVRMFINKKKLVTWVDGGLVLILVLFISVLILQFFNLVQFDSAYRAFYVISGVMILSYTVLLGMSVYDYRNSDGRTYMAVSVILSLGIVVQLMMKFVGRDIAGNHLFLPGAFTIYMALLWYMAVKRDIHVEPKKEELPYSEEEIRAQVVEKLNPKLLFASLKTLQNLIKNGSENSVKMIYYISVYMRSNLRAVEHQGEVVAFSEELEHIMAYLQLQKTRNAHLKFALECKVTDFRVPRNSLEPLVEKAVKYGVAGKGSTGNVVVRTYMRAEGYTIQIIDDGVGYDKKILKKSGTTSVLSLLSMLEQQCDAVTEIISQEGKGTVITIILPMLENDLMEKEDDELIPF